MKTFNKTLIAASLATLGMAAAPAALANVEASATVATSYLWRGLDLGSGTAALSADAVYSTGGFSAGVWVSSGDTAAGTEYDLFASYGGELGALGYSLGYAEYNYPTVDADGNPTNGFESADDLEDYIYSLSYAGVTATHYDAKDSDGSYNTLSFDLAGFGVLFGDHDRVGDGTGEMSHFDLSYGVNDSLSFTVSTIISSSSPADEPDTTVVASYSLPF